MENYYSITGTSRNSAGGARYALGRVVDKEDIINFAHEECGREGISLESVAGIEFIGINPDADGDFEEFIPAREWNEGEEFAAALSKLNDDGRTYEIFDMATECDEFIARADCLGLGNEARALVDA